MFSTILAAALQASTTTSAAVPLCGYEIVREFPHDPDSFTQGLLVHDGKLYEGTGQYGRSRVAILDLATGKPVRQSAYASTQFGEGIARWKDQLISLTWQNGIGRRWRLSDLKPLGTFRLPGEGWGLTTLGDRLVWSDGSDRLRFLNPATMTVARELPVTIRGQKIERLNELEAIDGQIWSNVWMTEFILRIDPTTGKVASVVDLRGLKEKAGAIGGDSVLNGIAWDTKARKLYVTGKNWPKLYEIKVGACR